MACFRPIPAYRAPGGRIVFDSKKGWSDRQLELPCGQCTGCRLERSRQWAIRCVHEAQMHTHNSFLTLTYDEEHLPNDKSLQVSDWQKFAKRLRKQHAPFRFFHCGEYGTENLRPHYHACVFGLDFHQDRYIWKQTKETTLYRSETLETIWGQGFSTIGELTFKSAAYVARYIMKKANGDLAKTKYSRFDPETGETWDVKPEYITMSRRPGIGAPWLTHFISDVYPSDEVVHDGQKYRPPRFYDQQLNDETLNTMKCKRTKAALRHKENNTPERLKVREKVETAKIERLTRQI